VIGQLLLGGLLISAVMGHPLVVRYGKGMDQMLRRPACLWGAIALRLIDVAAFVGRMACAAAILGFDDLAASDIMLLGFAALALSLNPLGRVGFREAAVTFVASRLVTDLSGTQLEGSMAQLALVESAGEALVAIPLGAVSLLWYRQRWLAAKGNGESAADDADERSSCPAEASIAPDAQRPGIDSAAGES
jgi:hypothetical protein